MAVFFVGVKITLVMLVPVIILLNMLLYLPLILQHIFQSLKEIIILVVSVKAMVVFFVGVTIVLDNLELVIQLIVILLLSLQIQLFIPQLLQEVIRHVVSVQVMAVFFVGEEIPLMNLVTAPLQLIILLNLLVILLHIHPSLLVLPLLVVFVQVMVVFFVGVM